MNIVFHTQSPIVAFCVHSSA